MNTFLAGAAAMLLIFIAIAGSLYAGYRLGSKRVKADIPKLPEKEAERLKQLDKGMQNILNYDISQAMRRANE